MTYFSRPLAISALLLAVSAVASATPIAAGGSVNPAAPVTTTNVGTVASYTNVAFTSQSAAGAPSTFNGTYTETVYRDSSNSLCSTMGSCLTFAITVANSSTSADGIETITSGPFSNLFTYNVGYVSTAAGIVPLNITDSIFGAMSFNFTMSGNTANLIRPGATSATLIIQTSATNFSAGSISVQDSQTATVAGFLPAAAVVTPEPSSLVLLGTGLIGTATTVLRRRKLIA